MDKLNYKKPQLWVTLISIILIVILAAGLLGNPPNKPSRTSEDYEERAAEFISLFYNQYENRDELLEIFLIDDELLLELENNPSNDGFYDSFRKEEIEGLIEESFGDILTIDAKSRLISNGIIPHAVINSKMIKATVSNIEFDELDADNEQSLFNALIIYEPIDGEPIEVEEKGVIRLVEDAGVLKVDYFDVF